MEAKKELEVLIESQRNSKEKGWLTEKGLGYLEGLEKAYNILFPRTVDGGKN